MTPAEQQINDALRALDEAHRLQRMQRNEYRQRRRVLIESLGRNTAGAGDTVRRAAPLVVAQQPGVLRKGRDNGTAQGAEGATTGPDSEERLLTAFAVVFSAIAVGVILYYWLTTT